MTPILREEHPDDIASIRHLIQQAFHNHPYSSGHESKIVDALRAADALDISLVVEVEGQVVGHVAFSKVTISGADCNWYGLGPVAVLPSYQSQGLGSLLIREGLQRLQSQNAAGCVLLGNPNYYQRFGFKVLPELQLEGVPPEHFMALSLDGSHRSGVVKYHPGFDTES